MNTILKSIANIFIPLIPAFIGVWTYWWYCGIEQLYYSLVPFIDKTTCGRIKCHQRWHVSLSSYFHWF